MSDQDKRIRDLEVALHNLVSKLDECKPHIDNAFYMAWNVRGHEYEGPDYGAEISSARRVLCPTESE